MGEKKQRNESNVLADGPEFDSGILDRRKVATPQNTNEHNQSFSSDTCVGVNLFSFQERVEYLKLYGDHSQHFTALQPGMSYYDVPGCGYIAFATHTRRCMILGDPVCHATQRWALIHGFLEANPNASFVHVSEAVADILYRDFDFYATMFGQELKVPLEGWSTSGKERKVIRKAVNQAQRQGITVVESEERLDVDDVSMNWLKTRKTPREIAFAIRPECIPYDEGCRYFYAWKEGRPIGFAYFDPAYKDGEVVSYLPNVSRACESFRQGLFYVIMVEAIRKFTDEGLQYLDLGLSPLAPPKQPRDSESRWLRAIFRFTYRRCFHYNCRGVHFTKQRFGGDWTPAYFCHRNALPIVDLWRLLRLSRVL